MMTPEELLNRIKKQIKKEWKLAFLSALVIGLATHTYVLTNALPNHDGLMNIYDAQKKYYSGRFFLSELSGISSYFDLPWLNGLLSLLFLSFAAVIIVEFFQMKRTFSIVFTSGLFATFPTIASTFAYMYSANGYIASFTLILLAGLLIRKYKYGVIPATIMIYITVGVYQVNFPLILTLVNIWLVIELLHNKAPLRKLITLLLKFTSSVVIGMAAYITTFKLYQHFTKKITNYQGLDEAGIPFGSLLGSVKKVFVSSATFFFEGFITSHPVNLFEVLNVFFFTFVLLGIIGHFIMNKVYKDKAKTLLLVFGLMFLPFSVYFLYFTSENVEYHMLMVIQMALIYILPLILYDRLQKRNLLSHIFRYGTLLTIFLIIFNFAVISNISYFNMNLKYEKMISLATRVHHEIERLDDYENIDKIAVVGKVDIDSKFPHVIVERSVPKMTGALGNSAIIDTARMSRALALYSGIDLEPAKGRIYDDLLNSTEVQVMNLWPNKNSIQVMDNVVVIKFNEVDD